MKALILAAGKGERFFPFNIYRPKPMFHICNRPLLQWTIERTVQAGVTDIGIVIGHRGGRVRNHFGNGNRFGCAITYIEQPSPKGTAHAVTLATDFLGTDDALVIHGDIFFGPQTLPQLLDTFAQQKSSGVAGITQVPNLESHTRAHIESDNTLTSYTDRPRGGSGPALMGIYIFKNSTLPELGNTNDFALGTPFGITPAEGQEIFDVIPHLHREGKSLTAVEITTPYFDMDMPWHPKDVTRLAVREMADNLPESDIAETATIDPEAQIKGPIFVGEGATIARDVYIEGPVWIGKNTHVFEGSHIGANTLIGDRCKIGPFAKVSGTIDVNCHITYLGEVSGIMLEEGRVTHQIQLSGIFGERAEIGAGTQVGTLRFDDAEIEVEVLGIRRKAPGFTGVLFGDYSRTGIGAMIMPGRIVGPCAMVGAGVVLMKNVPPNKAVLVKQELDEIDWSPEIYNK
ncbi:MAG: NTP transferase domain-containing protein [Candidatus Latescibacteria bacterium]|nr:NTP transferase domain-containing protein [Candidatus Latescibacterota bacterium]